MDDRKKISALAIVALIMLVATTAGCTTSTPSPTPTPVAETKTTVGNNTTFSSGTGFNITYPTAWKTDTTTNASLPVRIYIYLPTNNTVEGVNVGVQQLKANSTLAQFSYDQLSEIRRASETGLYQNFSGLTVNNNTTLAGKPAVSVTYQAIVPAQLSQTSTQNTTLKVMNWFVINNDRGCTITYKATPANYTKYQAQALQIVNSFRLI